MRNLLIALALLVTSVQAFELSVTGTVVSNNQKMIGARYMGYVKHIHFEIGDSVKRDDTLFEIESAEFDIMKNQADLFLEQAKIMVDMYRSRISEIRREKSIIQKFDPDNTMELENLELTADNLSASLASAQSLLDNATEKVKQMATITDYLEVKAPNDGIIVEKRIRVGDMIAPGMLAMILVDLDHLEVQAEVAESDMRYIEKGQGVDIEIPSLEAKTIGIVKSVVPSANPMAHTFKVIVDFDHTKHKVYPGMYAKVKMNIKANARDSHRNRY